MLLLTTNLQLADYWAETPPRSEEIKERIEAPICIAEIERAIHELVAKRCPGPDGQTTVFYKKCKNIISGHLHAVVIEARKANNLPPTLLNTYTVLFPNVGDE